MANTGRALRDLAKHYKSKFHIPFVALTGSVGKTTTKDMVAAVLGEKFKVLKTEGNLNNDIGVPMTLLRLNREHEIAVLELGMNHAGRNRLSLRHRGARRGPHHQCGRFPHRVLRHPGEDSWRPRAEYFSTTPGKICFVVLNGDDPLLRSLEPKLSFETVWCGGGEGLDYRASDIVSDGRSHGPAGSRPPIWRDRWRSPALGEHMIYPTLMAMAVGEHFGLTEKEIVDGVLHFAPTKMRMNIIHRADDITILNDTYNANPQSMRAAVEVLSNTKAEHKVAVLGDMFELGPLVPVLHAGVGEYLCKVEIDCLVAVGELARHIYDAAKVSPLEEVYYCPDKDSAHSVLDK